jgi:hypothetical protein
VNLQGTPQTTDLMYREWITGLVPLLKHHDALQAVPVFEAVSD